MTSLTTYFRALAVGAALLASSPPSFGAGLAQYLVARWTFPNGSLQGEPSNLAFAEGGMGKDTANSWENGFLRLGTGSLLLARDINSIRLPDLAKSVTLWAKLRLDATPSVGSGFVFGLTARGESGDWKDLVLALFCKADASGALSFGPYAIAQDGRAFGVGPSRLIPAKAGQELTVALTFDGATGTTTAWINGAAASQKQPGTERLSEFVGLALGRMKATGPVPVSFREVRVYSLALSPEWIDEVTADATP